jgi:Holliday junction resolvase
MDFELVHFGLGVTVAHSNQTEQAIQKAIIVEFERFGFFVLKLAKTNKNGIPDLLCIKDGRCIFIEVKTSVGVLSELQNYRIKQLKQVGATAIVASGKIKLERI